MSPIGIAHYNGLGHSVSSSVKWIQHSLSVFLRTVVRNVRVNVGTFQCDSEESR